jgi:hypothetical protein
MILAPAFLAEIAERLGLVRISGRPSVRPEGRSDRPEGTVVGFNRQRNTGSGRRPEEPVCGLELILPRGTLFVRAGLALRTAFGHSREESGVEQR